MYPQLKMRGFRVMLRTMLLFYTPTFVDNSIAFSYLPLEHSGKKLNTLTFYKGLRKTRSEENLVVMIFFGNLYRCCPNLFEV